MHGTVMVATGGIGSLGRRSTGSFRRLRKDTTAMWDHYWLLIHGLQFQWITKVPHGKFCIYVWRKRRGESAISLFHFTQMPIVEGFPQLLPLPWFILHAAPRSSHYGQSSCNGFCVLLDILQNCILVHPKQKRKQICLICLLFRNREPHTMRKPCIWPSTLILQLVTSHFPFQWSHSRLQVLWVFCPH